MICKTVLLGKKREKRIIFFFIESRITQMNSFSRFVATDRVGTKHSSCKDNEKAES